MALQKRNIKGKSFTAYQLGIRTNSMHSRARILDVQVEKIKNDPNSKFKTTKLLTTTFEENISHETKIDYISIDIEGGELNVLKSIDFEKYSIKVISVENNSPDKNNFKSFFSEKNFKYFDRIGHDEIFFNKKYFNV